MNGLRKDLATATIAIVFLTLLLGIAYPLVTTGVAQLVFPGASNGSKVEVDGKLVGSELIGQDFKGLPRYFQSRPSATEYSGDVTFFNNLGPNSRELSDFFAEQLAAYLKRERPYDPGLTRRRGAGRRGDHLGLRGRSPHLRGQRPHPGAPHRRGPRPPT